MQERAKITKEKILQTSIEEFSLKGFHGARIDEIALKAKVNKQRIYAYYQSKENLFSAVLKSCYEKITVIEEPLKDLAEEDIPHLAEIILKLYAKFHNEHPEFWRLLMWENLSEGEHLAILTSLRADSMTYIKQLYTKGQEKGIFKKEVSYEGFIYTLTSISYFMFSNRYTMSKMFKIDLSDVQYQNKLIKEALKMLSFPEKYIGEFPL